VSARILIGDMRDRLRDLPDNSVDSCVCDPPYHLTSIVKRFGSKGAAPAKIGKTGAYARASRGFMGQQWDGGGNRSRSAASRSMARTRRTWRSMASAG
jgi:site-specific DNA-methyltransferase (adenine-specific)